MHYTPLGKTHEQIKCDLRMANQSFAKLGREHGIHPSVFSAVCSGQKRSKRVANLIASALGSSVGDLWPQIYGEKMAKK